MSLSAEAEMTETRTLRRRLPWLASLLSLLVPGLGHIYVGQARRGLTVYALLLAWLWLFYLLINQGLLARFWVFASLMAAMVALFLFALIDPALKAGQARPYNVRWYAYTGLFVVGWIMAVSPCVLMATIPGSGYFHAVSGSMAPTLRVGEVFLADPTHYRSHQPGRDEVVIYFPPKHPTLHFVQRIAAIGGDRIAIKDGRAIVNGTPVDEPYIDVGDPKARFNNLQEEVVPAAHVYVIGDNRANSTDSRMTESRVGSKYAHGPVPVGNLVGRVTEIVFSREVSRIGRWVGTPAR